MEVLNKSDDATSTTKTTAEISQELQKLMLRIKGEFMDPGGNGVDYEKLQKSDVYKTYLNTAKQLKSVKLDDMNETERKAFFLNVYNALTIHGLLNCASIPRSVLDIRQFWKTTKYDIGGHVFSLDDIEHGVLRGNRSHPASSGSHFQLNDPKLKYSLKDVDPRIHFALNCGAKSCPAVRVYSASNLEKGLESAAKAFCEQEVTCHVKLGFIKLSKLFLWYREDFGGNDVNAARWVMSYVNEDIHRGISILLERLEEAGGVEIQYKDYDWTLNKV
ncbi:uncharacterized protein LOC141913203 [Tubulanus polymorphus]|uniref:uncharacterized protein LOC141913203 n=1 Tax=Tubulanus polymorphus TaxID=672921 RepID=UPI003DA6616A